MNLLYINSREIKLLSYKRDLFQQIKIDFFSKTHTTSLLDSGRISNTDVLASAIKEALSNVFKGQKVAKDIIFILPSPPFLIKRITLPLDIHPQAIQSFVNQKIITLYPYKNLEFFYTLHEKKDKRVAIIFCLERNILEDLSEITRILELNLKGVIPESLAYFKLIEATLSKTKKENIWYMHAHTNEGIKTKSYFYDNIGPLEEEKLEFEVKNLEELKKRIIQEKKKREEINFNRLILSGNMSLEVRQDLLTKEVGIWVNPFAKIIERFYSKQTKKMLEVDPKLFLKYDSHFSLLTHSDIPYLSLKRSKFSFEKRERKKRLPRIKPYLLPFTVSLLTAFLIVFGTQYLRKNKLKFPSKIVQKPSPTPTYTPTPSPTPFIKREELKLKILNGSGIKGQAAKLSTYLKDKGYKDIVIGNADNFDYSTSIIRVKDKKYLSFILKDLKELVEKPKTELLEEKNLPEDITIIIGKDLQL